MAPASNPGILAGGDSENRQRKTGGDFDGSWSSKSSGGWGRAQSEDVGARAEQVLRDVFGYPAFRGEQKEIVTHLANGGDALVLMPDRGREVVVLSDSGPAA